MDVFETAMTAVSAAIGEYGASAGALAHAYESAGRLEHAVPIYERTVEGFALVLDNNLG